MANSFYQTKAAKQGQSEFDFLTAKALSITVNQDKDLAQVKKLIDNTLLAWGFDLEEMATPEELALEEKCHELILLGISGPEAWAPAEFERTKELVLEYAGRIPQKLHLALYGVPAAYEPDETSSMEALQTALSEHGIQFLNAPLHIHSRPELFQVMTRVWTNELAQNINLFKLMEVAEKNSRNYSC